MSAKIYDGYRLAPKTTLGAFFDGLPAVMDPIHDRLDARLLAEETLFGLDRLDYRGKERPTAPLQHFAEAWAAEQREMSTSYRMQDPHRFELFHGTDPRDGRELIMLSVEEDLYREAFRALPGVEDFSYWNNSDRPENVSAEQWQGRYDAWLRVAPLAGPAMQTWRLRSDFIPGVLELASMPDNPLLLENAPSIEHRANRLSVDIYLSWLVKETGTEGSEIFSLAGRSFHADRTPLVEALTQALAPATSDLFQAGTGGHRLDGFKASEDALCRAVYESGDDEREEG